MRLFSLLALVLAGAPAAARAAVRGSAAERVLSAATLDASEQRQKLAPVEAAPRFAEATSQDVARAQLGMFPATIGIILVSLELLIRPRSRNWRAKPPPPP